MLDKTKTAMGGRLLRSWMERPLLDPVAISRRLEAVGWLVDNPIQREELVQLLREIPDLERLISRVVYGTAGARDLVALAAGLDRLPLLQNHLPDKAPSLLAKVRQDMEGLPELTALIARGIVDEPPFSVREGGLIRPGIPPRRGPAAGTAHRHQGGHRQAGGRREGENGDQVPKGGLQ